MKPAADLVVDAAQRHPLQRQLRHFQGVGVFGSQVVAQQKLIGHRLRELGLHPDAAVPIIEVVGYARDRLAQHIGGKRLRSAVRRQVGRLIHSL